MKKLVSITGPMGLLTCRLLNHFRRDEQSKLRVLAILTYSPNFFVALAHLFCRPVLLAILAGHLLGLVVEVWGSLRLQIPVSPAMHISHFNLEAPLRQEVQLSAEFDTSIGVEVDPGWLT